MSHHLLLCDDEIHILRAAEFKLARAGFEVQCANDGQEAWEAIQQRRPDMLITDCQMPRMNGFELCQHVRSVEALQDLPIVMLTAKGFELSQQELADRWNVVRLLNKPFSPRELLQLVVETLSRRETPVPAATV